MNLRNGMLLAVVAVASFNMACASNSGGEGSGTSEDPIVGGDVSGDVPAHASVSDIQHNASAAKISNAASVDQRMISPAGMAAANVK